MMDMTQVWGSSSRGSPATARFAILTNAQEAMLSGMQDDLRGSVGLRLGSRKGPAYYHGPEDSALVCRGECACPPVNRSA